MMRKTSDPMRRRRLSRRDFLKAAAAAGVLVGCQPSALVPTLTLEPSAALEPSATLNLNPSATLEPSATPSPRATASPTPDPTDTPPPTATSVPERADTPVPSDTPAPSAQIARGADLVKIYPEVQSRVVHTRYPGWDSTLDVPGALREMLDTSIMALTDLAPAEAAWAALFAPTERIAIKVNTIGSSSYWTHLSLVLAVVARVQSVGVPADNIVIFDRDTSELQNAGYPVNKNQGAVQCYGTDGRDTGGYKVLDSAVKLSTLLLDCDALINIPVLKQHGMAGISFAMKNHYGTFDKPWEFHHGDAIKEGMAALNALPAIKDRTRLIVGDALRVVQRGWRSTIPGDSILMSFDPVAHDAVGLRHYTEVIEANGRSAKSAQGLAMPWLDAAARIDVGTNDFDHIDVIERDL